MIRRNKQTLEAPKCAREGVLIGKDQLFEAGLKSATRSGYLL